MCVWDQVCWAHGGQGVAFTYAWGSGFFQLITDLICHVRSLLRSVGLQKSCRGKKEKGAHSETSVCMCVRLHLHLYHWAFFTLFPKYLGCLLETISFIFLFVSFDSAAVADCGYQTAWPSGLLLFMLDRGTAICNVILISLQILKLVLKRKSMND